MKLIHRMSFPNDECAPQGSRSPWPMGLCFTDACAQACQLCGLECGRHASKHQHCKVCAEVCQR